MKYFHLIILNIFINTFISTAQQQPDTPPIYPGCEKVEQKMPCLKKHLLNFIVENFNSDLLKKIKNKKQANLFISFIIDKTGKITQIKTQSSYNSLNKEIKQILYRLPIIQPAKKNQIPINVLYELPIVFEIKQ